MINYIFGFIPYLLKDFILLFLAFSVPTFLLGFFGFKDSSLNKILSRNIFLLPYFFGFYKYSERKIDFPFFGVWVFVGAQGQGKTLSMVRQAYLLHKKYDVDVFSNFDMSFSQYVRNIESCFYNERCVCCIDELGIVSNSKHSKDSNELLLRTTGQLRKKHKLILTTAQQLFMVNKDVRSQSCYYIESSCKFGRLFINKYYIPVIGSDGNIKKSLPHKIDMFLGTEGLFKLYDTYQAINS